MATSIIQHYLKAGIHAILEVLYPSFCCVCKGKLIQGEQIVCSDCLQTISLTEHALLEKNGIDLLFAELIHKEKRTVHFERGAAFAYYNRERGQTLRSMIEQGKFGRHTQPHIFYLLGQLAGKEYIDSDIFDDVDFLVPIPLHPRRLRERGFNQAEHICKGLNEILHIPIDTQHLVRTHNNPHQSRSSFHERSSNVKDIFAVHYPEEWKGKHIMLVDDVITSGSTMMACMKQMTGIRGCRISVFALGWAHS